MILALDGATSRVSVALLDGDVVVREVSAESPRGRSGGLYGLLEEVLREGGGIERVVVGTGPGSYNGIRSALAVAWGVAEARGVPLAGVSSLLGLAEGGYVAVGDARRGQYYFAVVRDGGFVREPVLLGREEVLAGVADVKGWPVLVPGPVEFLPEGVVAWPQAVLLGRLGRRVPDAEGVPEPLYLKAAYINTAVKARRRMPDKKNA